MHHVALVNSFKSKVTILRPAIHPQTGLTKRQISELYYKQTVR